MLRAEEITLKAWKGRHGNGSEHRPWYDSKQGQRGFGEKASYQPLRALKARARNLYCLLPSLGCLLKRFMGRSKVAWMMFWGDNSSVRWSYHSEGNVEVKWALGLGLESTEKGCLVWVLTETFWSMWWLSWVDEEWRRVSQRKEGWTGEWTVEPGDSMVWMLRNLSIRWNSRRAAGAGTEANGGITENLQCLMFSFPLLGC